MLFVLLMRWPWVICLIALLGTSPVFAASGWNCQSAKGGKDWRCSATSTQQPAVTGNPGTSDADPAAIGQAYRELGAESGPNSMTTPAKAGFAAEAESSSPFVTRPSNAPPPADTLAAPAADSATAPAASGRTRDTLKMKKFSEVPEMDPSSPQRGSKAKSAGWDCRGGEDGKEWRCGLVGPDPRGETHVVREPGEDAVNWAETADITEEDERRFRFLSSMLPSNPWALHCGKREEYLGTDFLLSPADRRQRETAPLEIRSDYGELHGGELATFTGAARVSRADQTLSGDLISRHALADTMTASGNVSYQEKGMTFSSDSGFLDLSSDKAILRNSQFILSTVPARGVSRVTHFDSKDVSRYEQFAYTACPPGDRDWVMHADNVKIDKESGEGTAKHAWIDFKGVPFFYTPYMTFPVDDRRKTGFLAPSAGYSKYRGFDLEVPYYFNLAPNYDLTVWPRVASTRGVLLHGEFRYMTPYNQGRLIADVVPDDRLGEVNQESDVEPGVTKTNIVRGQAGFLDNAWLTENFRTHVDLNYVSDKNYLYQWGNQLALIDFNYVRSNATATYTGSNYGVSSSMDVFQTINPAIPEDQRPYMRLPALNSYYWGSIGDTGLSYNLNGEATYFSHNVNVDGQRLNLRPQLQYPLRNSWGYIKPSLTLQMTQYALQNQQQGLGTSPNRTLPIASFDSGLFFERDLTIGGAAYTHTLEPRLFYVYIPYQNQDDFPLFDTINYDFNSTQLFRENRFTGADRLGDANQVTLALTSRLADNTSGRDRIRATLGEIYYFRPRKVNLPGYTEQSGMLSNVIADVTTLLTDRWSLYMMGQVNPYGGQIERRNVALHYGGPDNDLLNVGYLYLNQPNNQDFQVDLIDSSARLPIPWTEGWHAIGRWQYSLLNQTTLEAFLGLERETCCWRFTLIGRKYINSITSTGATNSGDFVANSNYGVFAQFELKGLTRLGNQLEKLLYRSIRGYRIPEN